jgi:hypothetical protein
VLAGAAAAVLVLLTGIAVGLVGRQECAPGSGPQQQPTSQAPASSAPPSTPTGSLNTNPPEGNTGGNTGGGNSLGGPVGSRPESNPTTTAEPSQPAAEPTQQAQPAATEVAQPAADETCEPGKFAAGPALVATAGAGLAAALAIGLLLAASLRRPVPVPVSGAPAAGGRVPPGADPRLDADRAALVRACIYVRDRVTSRALADRLAAALRDAGVTVVEPVGDRFDPARHEAGGATPVSDPSLTGTIAAVEVPGYIDRTGRVLRAPVVTVYQAGPGGGGSTTAQHTAQHSTTTQQHPRRRIEEDR